MNFDIIKEKFGAHYIADNVTLVQPPFIDVEEYSQLPNHELEYLYMNNSLELYCFHFGLLAKINGKSEYRV